MTLSSEAGGGTNFRRMGLGLPLDHLTVTKPLEFFTAYPTRIVEVNNNIHASTRFETP